jgi:hypothetical protein
MAHDDTLMKASKRYHDNKAGATVTAFFFYPFSLLLFSHHTLFFTYEGSHTGGLVLRIGSGRVVISIAFRIHVVESQLYCTCCIHIMMHRDSTSHSKKYLSPCGSAMESKIPFNADTF